MLYYPFYHQSELSANYAVAPSQNPHETDNSPGFLRLHSLTPLAAASLDGLDRRYSCNKRMHDNKNTTKTKMQ